MLLKLLDNEPFWGQHVGAINSVMKSLFFLSLLVQTTMCYAQVPQEQPSSNSSFNSFELAQPVVADSIQVERLNEISIKSAKGSVLKKEIVADEKKEYKSIKISSNKFMEKRKIASNQANSRSAAPLLQIEMDKEVALLKNSSPNSFEYYLSYYMAGNYNVAREDALKNAARLAPTDADVLTQSMGNALAKNDAVSAKFYVEKLKNANLLSEEVLAYAMDLLLSSGENQVLITHGFFDTYGVAYQQFLPDCPVQLTMISLELLQSESYRNVISEKGYNLPQIKNIDSSYLLAFCQLNKDKNIALSMTLPKAYLSPLKELLYPVGLVFEYRPNKLSDGVSLLMRNELLWNQILAKHNVIQFTSVESNNLASNYLPMLLYLKTMYELNDDKLKLAELVTALNFTAHKAGKLSLIKKQ